MDQALSAAERSKEDVEVRLLRVPALNFEGLWLTGDASDPGDQIVPLRNVGRLLRQPARAAERSDGRPARRRPSAGADGRHDGGLPET